MRMSLYLGPITLICIALLTSACADKQEGTLAGDPESNGKTRLPADENAPTRPQDSSEAPNVEHSKKTAGPLPAVLSSSPKESANAALATPNEVMGAYLADTAADGKTNSPTIGRELHKRFSEEKRDKSWAEYVEPQVNYYLEKQRVASNFMTVAVQCRETMCEILAVNRSPANTSADVDRWQKIIYAMKREQWYATAHILEPAVEFGSGGDGRVAILTYLIRG